jgi:hypothetical protein
MRVDDVVALATQGPREFGRKQRVEYEYLLVTRSRRLLAIGGYVRDAMHPERCIPGRGAEMIGEDVDLVTPAPELLGDSVDADRGSARRRKGARRDHRDTKVATHPGTVKG